MYVALNACNEVHDQVADLVKAGRWSPLAGCSSRAAHRRYESLDLETQHAQHTITT
jgi:hypothetical protein